MYRLNHFSLLKRIKKFIFFIVAHILFNQNDEKSMFEI